MEVLVGATRPRATLSGLKVGILSSLDVAPQLEAAGAHLEETEVPSFDHLIPLHMAEFSITHAHLYGEHADEYSPEAREMLRRGMRVSAAAYRALQSELELWRKRCHERLDFDVLVSPAFVGRPPLLDEPETPELLLRFTQLTRPYNLLGWPAAVTRDGIMFAGRSDSVVLGAALAWENGCEEGSGS
jgi:Asp-tRNA(Asn)/Glu-tRNA(Gln) amidotransferase A subunit family amidase